MFKKLTTCLTIVLAFNMAFAQPNYQIQNAYSNDTLKGYALYAPAGITCEAVLSQEINSNSAIVGQTINAVLMEDFKYDNKLIAQKGSVVSGNIVQIKKASFGARNAKMQILFTTIRTPYNNVIPINATIYTTDLSGTLKASSTLDTTKEYAKDIAIGTATGAVLGTAVGAMKPTSTVGEGAIYGVALGAGMGLAKKISEKGQDIIIPSKSTITLYFNQPITLTSQ